jgi:23S rRNA (adenine2503-C2)-methyltransferase
MRELLEVINQNTKIGGGCGMLWFVQDWMKKNPDHVKKSAGTGLVSVHTPR